MRISPSVAVFGGGSIGTRHARNARTLGCEVAIIDPCEEVLARGWRDGLPVYGNIRDVEFEPDAWVIASPLSTHLELVVDAVSREMPFFVEKPLGRCEEIPEWERLAAGSLPIHQLGYQNRFHPDAALIRSLSAESFYLVCDVAMSTWPGRYGDPVLECSHDLDLLLWWGCESVVAAARMLGQTKCLIALGGTPNAIWSLSWNASTVRREWSAWDTKHRKMFGPSIQPLTDALYVDELDHFLNRVSTHSQKTHAAQLTDGLKVLEVRHQLIGLLGAS